MSCRSDSIQYTTASNQYMGLLSHAMSESVYDNIDEQPVQTRAGPLTRNNGSRPPAGNRVTTLTVCDMDGFPEIRRQLRRQKCLLVFLGCLTVISLTLTCLCFYLFYSSCKNNCPGRTYPIRSFNGSFQLLTSEDLEKGSVNLAVGRPAFQSSVMDGHNASLVVDGNFRADMASDGSCSHTEHEAQPWWKVDLGAMYRITSIAVTARGNGKLDCRNNNIEIRVGNDNNHSNNALCYHFLGNFGRGITRIFRCNTDLQGQWVSIQRVVDVPGGYLGYINPDHPMDPDADECKGDEPLELCEVMVYSV